MNATESVARAVMVHLGGRWHSWTEDRLYDVMWVFGDCAASAPGRHIICDGTTDHPVVIANVRGRRLTIELAHVVGIDDVQAVVDTLTAFGALDGEQGQAAPDGELVAAGRERLAGLGKTPGWDGAGAGRGRPRRADAVVPQAPVKDSGLLVAVVGVRRWVRRALVCRWFHRYRKGVTRRWMRFDCWACRDWEWIDRRRERDERLGLL